MTPAALNRIQAAEFVGVSATTFDKLVRKGHFAQPYHAWGNKRWDVGLLEEALRSFPFVGEPVGPMGHVYIIGAVESPYVKIGFATHVAGRLKELQTGNPETLCVIGTMRGQRSHEKDFHAALRPFRARGEWFRRGPWLDAVLEGIAARETPAAILKRLEAMG